jgi:hypothetical protein
MTQVLNHHVCGIGAGIVGTEAQTSSSEITTLLLLAFGTETSWGRFLVNKEFTGVCAAEGGATRANCAALILRAR